MRTQPTVRVSHLRKQLMLTYPVKNGGFVGHGWNVGGARRAGAAD